ncbi:glycoside hydrolase family 20 zincin-like fold domain-containing protein [Flavilitoribacter nigricans]|uniref:glycoside hydrolase family 20 zincin-like fold domain-containing protein n=1 Tax=Flavilitoribacter nigricans TaxID=70997 RepID=UPI003743ADBF
MEELGDVKTAYLEARSRVEERLDAPQKWNLEEGYFVLNNRTGLRGLENAPGAIEKLQQQLKQTGGYELQAINKDRNNTIVFSKDSKLGAGNYRLHSSRENIEITAGDENGFQQAIQTLMKIMDDKIWQQEEMHNPTWTVAAVDITGSTAVSNSSL